MALSIEQMRQALIGKYSSSAKWRIKVAKMTDSQVVATYLRLKLKNQI